MYAKLYSERCATTVVWNVFVEQQHSSSLCVGDDRFSIYCYVKRF